MKTNMTVKTNMKKRGTWREAVRVLAAAAVMAAGPAAYGQGAWTSLAPLPAATEGMTVGGVGEVIIAAYGFSGGDTNLTRLYNINTNTWSFGAPAPLPVRSEEAYGDTTHGGLLYVAGGRSAGVLNNLERYNPVTNTWTTLTPMPTARAGSAAATVGNALFVIGGRLSTGGPCSGGPYLATVERYDIDTDSWSAAAPLPSPRSDLAAVESGGKIYVFGGCNGSLSGFLADVDVYDPVTDSWSTAPADMPTARASLVAGKVGNLVFAIGGWAGGPTLGLNEVYNVAKDSWSTAAPITTPRGDAGVYSQGGRVFVVGGSQPAFGASVAANEAFTP